MEEEELVCGGPSTARHVDEAGAPFWSSEEEEEHGSHDFHAVARATEGAHLASHASSHAAPPELYADADPAITRMEQSLDARAATRSMVETGDPMHVPGPDEAVVWPAADGARDGVITRDTTSVGESWERRTAPRTRVEDDTGTFFSDGDSTIPERALKPEYRGGERVPDYIGTDTEYTVAREFPAERSVARDWFAQPGGAEQVRTGAAAGELVDDGFLDFERSMSVDYATPTETSEIYSAVQEEMLAEMAARPAPHSPDMATMVDDIDAARLGDLEAERLAALEHADLVEVPPRAPRAPRSSTPEGTGGGGHVDAMGVIAAIGGAHQFGTGIGEFLTGHYEQGTLDTAAGGLGLGTSLATMGMLGEGATATMLASGPAGLAALGLGMTAAGHEYNAEHDVWGDATVDENGEVHHLTSVDFALANGADAFNGIHDAVTMGLGGGDVADGAGIVLGGVGGGLVGLGAGVIGLGGDLYNGLGVTLEGLANVATAGDRYMADRGVWDDPNAPAVESAPSEAPHARHHRSSVDMVVDDTRATYAEYHDAAAEAGLGEVGATIAGGAAGTAMAVGDSVLALGGNLGGLGLAAIDAAGSTLADMGHAASDLWSWMTD